MQLTKEQEQEIVSSYYGLLYTIAKRFYSKAAEARKLDLEDYVQECLIVFLRHIRAVVDESQIFPLPSREMRHAMCVLALGELPVSVPDRTTDFSKLVSQYQSGDSLDELAELGWDPGGSVASEYSEVDERLSYEAFFAKQSPKDQQLLVAMTKHRTAKEAAAELGVNASTVCRRVAQLKSKYLLECSLEDIS